MSTDFNDGLALHPFRAVRPDVAADRLAQLLCPPYDVISDSERQALLDRDVNNAVGLILPVGKDGADAYAQAARQLSEELASGLLAVDPAPAIYVYEMRSADGSVTRGLVGAIELRDPADGVILPHENTMAGPVADRLALMDATEANLEPIYLVYDGGGAASAAVSRVDDQPTIAETTTGDGITHRLWAITDPQVHADIAADLRTRRGLIADGHHRYATYRELQQQRSLDRGAGPWDRGLTLLVDSTSYGPQVHAIHRVLVGVPLDRVIELSSPVLTVVEVAPLEAALQVAEDTMGFAVVVTDGARAFVLSDPTDTIGDGATQGDEPEALGKLDVTILHRVLVERTWGLADTVETVGYAHTVAEALADAARSDGTAVLLRPTPVAAVAAVAAAGARMPRKSTLFTPKPASGLLMRRFADES